MTFKQRWWITIYVTCIICTKQFIFVLLSNINMYQNVLCVSEMCIYWGILLNTIYFSVFDNFDVIVHHLKSYFASIFGIQIGSFLDCASNTDLALDNLFIWILTPSQKRFFKHQTPFRISICIQSSMCFDSMLGQHHS